MRKIHRLRLVVLIPETESEDGLRPATVNSTA